MVRVRALNERVRCVGVSVGPGDVVVADEEGVVAVPGDRRAEVLSANPAQRGTPQARPPSAAPA